jgi:hypothetical protein
MTNKLKNKVFNKYASLKIIESQNGGTSVQAHLECGEITGPAFRKEYPTYIHDTYQDAVEFAEKKDNSATWCILPVIQFSKR